MYLSSDPGQDRRRSCLLILPAKRRVILSQERVSCIKNFPQNPYVKGCFDWLNGHRIRTRTSLIWGPANGKVIGAVLMINPGSCEPQDPDLAERWRKGGRGGKIGLVRAKLDPTQRRIASVVAKAYARRKRTPHGQILIRNLFCLAEPELQKAVAVATSPGGSIYTKLERIPKSVPWLWLAWGTGKPQLDHFREAALHRHADRSLIWIPSKKDPSRCCHPGRLSWLDMEPLIDEIARRI